MKKWVVKIMIKIERQSMRVDYLFMCKAIAQWLDDMSEGLKPGRFRFCKQGSFVPERGLAGMVSTVFAMKIAWQIGIWEGWPKDRQHACIDFIRSFQRQDGRFVDPWLYGQLGMNPKDYVRYVLGRFDPRSLEHKREKNIDAETRQTTASLLMVGAWPDHPLPVSVHSPGDGERFILSFDWSLPWHAASHLSHQMMFLAINKEYFGIEQSYDCLINEILRGLEDIRDPATGTWFVGDTSNSDKLNGAMKIFSGLQWLKRPYPDCSGLLDFALQQPIRMDGCHFLNCLFVIYNCRTGVPQNFRQHEIIEFAFKALDEIDKFRKNDGGFSFYQDRSQMSYLGVAASKGLSVSDMHGTVMLSWALALIADLLGDAAPADAKQWRAHKS
jgi:hypothetical protein